MASTAVLGKRLKWYQVVLSVGRSEVRERVKAAGVDAAARAVMRSHGLACAESASIWLLGRSGAYWFALSSASCCSECGEVRRCVLSFVGAGCSC